MVGNKTGPTRLGFVLLLKFFEIEGRFPRSADELPPAGVVYVAEQVQVDAAEVGAYRWSGRTIEYHRAQLREAFGFRESTRGDEDKLAGWLAEEVCPVELRDEQLREALLVRCGADRIEPPGRVERVIGSARATFEQRVLRADHRTAGRCVPGAPGGPGGRRGRSEPVGGAESRPRSGWAGDAAARDRQADRDTRARLAGGPVRRHLGEADRRLARPRRCG